MARLTNLTERGLVTQRELSEALIELSLAKGFPAVTIKDITDHLGVDRTTFYLHFKDKDELVLATQRRTFDELSENLGEDTDPFRRLAAFFERIGSNRKTWMALLKFEDYPRFEGRFAEYIGSTLTLLPLVLVGNENAARLPRPLVSRFIVATVRACALWWLEQPDPCAPEAMAEMTEALLLSGLR
jgi:AcrR family transcriptional regulator